MRCRVLIVLMAVCASGLNLGCASRDRSRSRLDHLWEQGYGFKNPNVDKVRTRMRELE